MKKQLLILIALFLLVAGKVGAQQITAATYAFSRSGFAPATITAPDTLIGPNADDSASLVTDIGFTFWFAGTPYTQFSVSENGVMTLGDVQISGSDFVNDMAAATPMPKIAPYWDDLATGTTGSVVYKLTGTAPNRILMINWNVTIPKNTANAPNAIIQVQLSETTGNITFTYGWPALPANANLYSVGIGNSPSDFASVTLTGTGATATCAYGTANNNNSMGIAGYSRFNFFPDKAAPTITGTVIPNTGGLGNRTCTRVIADSRTGVPITGTYIPRIYFKKSTDTEYISSPGVLQSGTSANGTWLFTIDHSLLINVAEGDYINYFVAAQDQATTTGNPNVSSLPSGVIASDVNTIITPPATPSTYIIGASFTGVKTVGDGGNFTSFTNTGGLFEQLNAGTLTGNVTIQVISDIANESGQVALNEFAAPYTMTITPVGNRTVTANSGNALFRLNGTDRVTIDGLNDGTNSLTLINNAGNIVQFYAGASDNVITNATLKGISASTGGVIFFGDCSNTASNSNNSINHCTITSSSLTIAPYAGVYMSKFSGTAVCTGNIIDHNVMTGFGQRGIHDDRGYLNSTFSNNDIYQANGSGYGIGIYMGGTSTRGTVNIFNNYIHDLNVSSNINQYAAGIQYASGGSTDVLNIYNNVVTFQTTVTNPTADKITGLSLGGPGTSNVYYNTVYIGGSEVTSGNTVCVHKLGGTVNLKNNIIFNARSNTSASQYYCHYAIGVNNLTNVTSDYNNLYVSGTSGYVGSVGINPGMSQGTQYSTLAAWQTGTAKDAGSITADPVFDIATNDYIPGNNAVNAGVAIAGITTDINGSVRDVIMPTIGAYELPCTSPVTGGEIALAVNTGCAPFDPEVITSTSLPTGSTGTLEYKWQVSAIDGTTGFTDIENSNAETYDPAALTVNTWFRRLARVDCKGSWLGATASNTVQVTVNDYPVSVTISESENTVCAGTQVTFTATPVNGGDTPLIEWYKNNTLVGSGISYTYSPANGDDIHAVLTSSLTPCASGNPATSNSVVMVVNPVLPVSVMIFASQNPVCSGTPVNFFAFGVNGGTAPVYQWKVNGQNVGTNMNNYMYMPQNGDVVTCEMTSNVVCPSVATAVSNPVNMGVTESVTPSISITASNNTVCAGSTISFTSVSGNGGLSPAYQWKVNGVNAGTNSPNFTYTAPAYNTQTVDAVTCVLTSSATCATTQTVTSNSVNVTVNPVLVPSVTIVPDANNVCAGTLVTFTATPTNGGNAPVYQWYKNGAASGTNSAMYADIFTNGDIVSVVMTSNATPCLSTPTVNSNEVTVIVNDLPTATVSTSSSNVCIGSSTSLTFTFTGTGPWDFSYSDGTATYNATGVSSPYTVSVSPSAETTYSVTSVTDNGTSCSNNNSASRVTIYVNPLPTVVITNPAPVNYPATADLTAPAITTGSTTGLEFTYWTDAAASVSYTTPAAASVGTYYIKGTNPTTGCFDIKPVKVTGLISYWHLDEAAGNTYVDVTGINNGTGNVSPSAVSGQVNGGQLFNGTTTKIDVPADPSLDIPADGDLSVEFWYKNGNVPSSTQIVVSRFMSQKYWYAGISYSGRPIFKMSAGNTDLVITGNVITDGQWHHVTATHNGVSGQAKLYVDGILRASATQIFVVNFSSPTTVMQIGSLNNNYKLTGNLDELALYNTELSLTDIQQHYNNGLMGLGYFDPPAPAAMPLVLATPENELPSMLRAYAVNNDEIRVIGDVTGGSEATLFDLYGKQVIFRKLEGGDLNIIPTPGIGTGIYILRVNDHGRIETFKLLIKE